MCSRSHGGQRELNVYINKSGVDYEILYINKSGVDYEIFES